MSKRPSLSTLSKSNSRLNLNWKRFEPTSIICTPFSKLHARLNVFCATRLLNGLHVRNLPIRLREQLSISSFQPSSDMVITSSSSVVNLMFSNLFITSSAIILQTLIQREEKTQTLIEQREGEVSHLSRERSPTQGEFVV